MQESKLHSVVSYKVTNLVTAVIGFRWGALRDHLILPKVLLFWS